LHRKEARPSQQEEWAGRQKIIKLTERLDRLFPELCSAFARFEAIKTLGFLSVSQSVSGRSELVHFLNWELGRPSEKRVRFMGREIASGHR